MPGAKLTHVVVEHAVAEQSKVRKMNYVVRWGDDSKEVKKDGLGVGTPAATFMAPLLAGGTFDFSKALGQKPAVVVFWASWCEPCLKEAPHLIQLYEKYKSKGVEFVAVSIDEADDHATLAKVVADLSITYPIALDPDGEVLAKYAQGASIPLTFLIGADGKVVYRHQNFAEGDEAELEEALKGAIAEAKATDSESLR